MAVTTIPTAGITNDAVDNTKLDLAANYAFTGTVSGVVGAFGNQLFHMQHTEASSVGGGSASADTFNDRVLNSTVINQISGASLSSNQFTLPTGTFVLNATAKSFETNRNFLAIYSVTNSGLSQIGQSNHSSTSAETTATIWCRLTTTSSHTFKLQHWTESAGSANIALGIPSNKTTNYHADVLIWKVA